MLPTTEGHVGIGAAMHYWARARSTAVILADVLWSPRSLFRKVFIRVLACYLGHLETFQHKARKVHDIHWRCCHAHRQWRSGAPRITAEDSSCSANLASQLSCPARLSRSVAAHFRLKRNRSPRRANKSACCERAFAIFFAAASAEHLHFFCRQPRRLSFFFFTRPPRPFCR